LIFNILLLLEILLNFRYIRSTAEFVFVICYIKYYQFALILAICRHLVWAICQRNRDVWVVVLFEVPWLSGERRRS